MNRNQKMVLGCSALGVGIFLLFCRTYGISKVVLLIGFAFLIVGVCFLLRYFSGSNETHFDPQPQQPQPEASQEPTGAWEQGLKDAPAVDIPNPQTPPVTKSATPKSEPSNSSQQKPPPQSKPNPFAGQANTAQQGGTAGNGYQHSSHQAFHGGTPGNERFVLFSTNYMLYTPGVTRYFLLFSTGKLKLPENAPSNIEVVTMFSTLTLDVPDHRSVQLASDSIFGQVTTPQGWQNGMGARTWSIGTGEPLRVRATALFSTIRAMWG